MTTSSSPIPTSPPAAEGVSERRQEWRVAIADEYRSKGWTVVIGPGPEHLPAALQEFHPDLVAHRGDENFVIEICGPGLARPVHATSEKSQAATLEDRFKEVPGWRMVMRWTGDDQPPAPTSVLADRARRAAAFADTDLEAALLLAWSALEGTLARRFDELGMRSYKGFRLLAELYRRGHLDDPVFLQIRAAHNMCKQLKHGRRAPVDRAMVDQILALVASPEFAT
jgi:hypothetical protein